MPSSTRPPDWINTYSFGLCPCQSQVTARECCLQDDGTWRKQPVGELISKVTNYCHPKCYLSRFGGCSTKLTGEHIISEAILRQLNSAGVVSRRIPGHDALRLFGSTGMSEIGFASAKANILCYNHNSLLSPIDHAASKCFRTITANSKLAVEAERARKPSCIFSIVSGLDLERWFIKLYCGLVTAKKVFTEQGTLLTINDIHPDVLEALIGRKMLEYPLGIFTTMMFSGLSSSIRGAVIRLNKGSDDVAGLACGFSFANLMLLTHKPFAEQALLEGNSRRPDCIYYWMPPAYHYLMMTY